MEVGQQHPAAQPLAAVARIAASDELLAAIGPVYLEPLHLRVAQAEAALSSRSPGAALYELARHCIGLPNAVDDGFDDGTFEAAGVPASEAEDNEDCGWDFGIAVAEAIAAALAAFAACVACDREAELTDLVERLSLDLDFFSAHLFGGLRRLGEAQSVSQATDRLLLALQRICVWAMVALGRAVGYQQFSAAVLWEWACRDALWTAVLSKGVLSAGSVCVRNEPCLVPEDAQELRQAVLKAFVGLASPEMAFLSQAGGNDIAIANQNEALVQHRQELAAAVVSSQLCSTLVSAAADECACAPDLVSFLVLLIQPELAGDSFVANTPAAREAMATVMLGGQSATATKTVGEAKLSSASLCHELEHNAAMLWQLLAEASGMQSGSLPPGFWQNCAQLSYFVPVPDNYLLHFLTSSLQSLTCDAAEADAVLLVALCFVAANSGEVPSSGGPLVEALDNVTPEMKESMDKRWERWQWQGPVRLDELTHWAVKLEVAQVAAEIAAMQIAEVPTLHSDCLSAQTALPELPAPARGQGTRLQELVHDAPPIFRCAHDGQLMMDPVRTPQGYVMERAGLAHALTLSGGRCPLTGEVLCLEDCPRQPELRRKITRWIRERKGAS
eukprot:TRINITY_DN108166_c0_g1_i1.p1 TRINITY_DN108166_c0_g1~~TRINITY_DN108166_c0_g1_i1.p1  ORF type:complete len:628 (+),score=153.41 TRINITY_DN108166_c0_g1_i1:38-1885(+)